LQTWLFPCFQSCAFFTLIANLFLFIMSIKIIVTFKHYHWFIVFKISMMWPVQLDVKEGLPLLAQVYCQVARGCHRHTHATWHLNDGGLVPLSRRVHWLYKQHFQHFMCVFSISHQTHSPATMELMLLALTTFAHGVVASKSKIYLLYWFINLLILVL